MINGKAANKSELDADVLTALYSRPLPARRTGPLYGAFPFPTKISPEAIALYIAAHTAPGDTILDGFAGSGTTGLAALLCENPTDGLREEAERLGLDAKWGARNAVLYELGQLGAFVARTLTSPPDPAAFRKAGERLLENAERLYGWAYSAADPDGGAGVIRHVVWSDRLRCPSCRRMAALWDGCVSLNPARIGSLFKCPHCSHESPLDGTARVLERRRDPITGCVTEQRSRRIARVYGATGKRTWSRPPTKADAALLGRIVDEPLPDSLPNVVVPWGDLHRRGYHRGMTHLHHFYTRRNLMVFARLWERAAEHADRVRDALRFWLPATTPRMPPT